MVPLHLAACGLGGLSDEPWPLTRAEASGFRETSRHGDVMALAGELCRRSPNLTLTSMGRSSEGRELVVILAADPPVAGLEQAAADPRPKVLLLGNIHGGEVEGKEALLAICREFAQGRHQPLLRDLICLFAPLYNPDGNEAVDPGQRRQQAGPYGGVGRRANGAGLDLNRDFVKAEAPETRALLRMLVEQDPVMLVDCHTTDGSYHGFDLTYAGPLSPLTDPELLLYQREILLPELRHRLAAAGFQIYDYGNWRDPGDGREAPSAWETYDHRPRFGTNYVGLRNRLALLAEAYAHAPFDRRVAVTRAVVLQTLALLSRDLVRVQALCREADARASNLSFGGVLPSRARLGWAEMAIIPSSSVTPVKDPTTGRTVLEDTEVHTWWRVPSYVRFEGLDPVQVPPAFAVPAPPASLVPLLAGHGIALRVLSAPLEAEVEALQIRTWRRASRAFQGHHLQDLRGEAQLRRLILPAGTVVVPSGQPLGRLVFALLDPAAGEDSLATWGILQPSPHFGGAWHHPVLRLRSTRPPMR